MMPVSSRYLINLRFVTGIMFIISLLSAQAQNSVPILSQSSSYPSSVLAPQNLVQQFWQGQDTLRQTMSALEGAGDTDDEIEIWRQQNVTFIDNQLSLSRQMQAYAYFQPVDYITDIDVPNGTSPEMETFMTTKANLYNNLALIHNQLASNNILPVSIQNVDALNDTEQAQFLRQNATTLQSQSQLEQRVAAQLAHRPDVVPDAPPPTTNMPQPVAAYMLLSYELDREEALLHNQYCAGDLNQLETIMEQWRQVNIGRFHQLQALAMSASTQNSN